MKNKLITRRRLLRTSFSGSLLFLAGCAKSATTTMPGMNHGNMNHGNMGQRSSAATPMAMTAHPGRALNPAFTPDVDIALSAIQTDIVLLPGKATQVWKYDGQVIKGEASIITQLPNSSIGPIIRLKKGQKVRVRFTNKLPDKNAHSVVHWHGLHLPEDMDGHPRIAIAPDSTYTYEFEVKDRAGTYWFHPHPHGETARQVFRGLAGLLIVSDAEEQALGLPSGEFDVPLVIQDRTFNADNQLQYLGTGAGMMGSMMAQMMGFLGDKILVNGRINAELAVATRAYRLRLLNGSNSRIYKLAWSDGTPLIVIGTDGGLLDKAAQRNYVTLSPGERVELFADFSKRNVGDSLKLVSMVFEGAENVPVPAAYQSQSSGMMPMAMNEALPMGHAFDVMTVKVARDDAQRGSYTLPSAFSPVPRLKIGDAINAARPRTFEIDHVMMNWRINGKQWEGDIAAPEEQVKLNTTEVWEFVNKLNLKEMMDPMGMAHPIHIHGVQFQVIERKLAVPELQSGYDTVRAGFMDEGLKDTFLLMPSERVKVLLHFSDFTGKFVYHCHNLEHEDQGLMRNYQVQ